MNPQIILEILTLITNLLCNLAAGATQKDAAVAQILLQIGAKVEAAYTQHMGEPLDPALVQPKALIP